MQAPASALSSYGPKRHLRERREELSSLSFSAFEALPQSPTLGAEIRGIDLAAPLDDATVKELRQALVEFKVIFFRDQDITTEQHVRVAGSFGDLEVHPFLPSNTDFPELVRFEKSPEQSGFENMWHSDVSWRLEPSLGSMLRCIEAPRVGGDTLFVDMVAAYKDLPDDVRERIEGMHAIHDFSHSFGVGMSEEKLQKFQQEYPPARHPVVRSHPETGEKILYVNRIFVSHLEGIPRDESDELIAVLCRQSSIPEFQMRLRWEKNSIAFWDNRSTQHYAASDYWPEVRIMERATVIGDRPF
ncbi:TauD/TfdA family dioxygenase [Myxococcota bacterium]|nr:TauD/TfdA family dioxygenase [Myxococcota bacterium]